MTDGNVLTDECRLWKALLFSPAISFRQELRTNKQIVNGFLLHLNNTHLINL